MPAVLRLGDPCTGHECWPPRPNIEGSPNVYVNGKPAHRQGDAYDVHCCTHPGVPHGCHDSILAQGSSSVYVNGIPLGRVGDAVMCGGFGSGGSPNVFAGG